MDILREVQAALYDTRMRSGDAIIAFIELQAEVQRQRRLIGKLLNVAPELVEAAYDEINQEDEERA